MIRSFAVAFTLVAALAVAACQHAPAPEEADGGAPVAAPEAGPHGTIRGHVRLTGTPPKNPEIRMVADPMCAKAYGGPTAVMEAVLADASGGLANAFVQVQGSFPGAPPAPTTPVLVDQVGCLYTPRVVGVRLGQPFKVRNSDPGLHNVHGTAKGRDSFNIGQPMAGIVNDLPLKDEGMLRLQCDVHAWMLAFIGVVSHPYFAVSEKAGTFEIRDVPAGMQTVQAWHERFGAMTATAVVPPNGVVDVELAYTGDEKPTAEPRTLTIPDVSMPGHPAGS